MYTFNSKNIPDYSIKVARILIKEGYDCFLVGGAVRDNLLNIPVFDYDFTTNALPEDLIEIEAFPKSVQINKKFGTLKVLEKDVYGETQEVEITTYRKETDYIGGRWPDKVEFGVSLLDDLSRRDFTINAMAVDMKQFVDISDLDDVDQSTATDVKIIDPYGGLLDLESKIIKCVGDPMERFSEDGLRTLRAIRIATNLQFTIEDNTYNAISKTLHITKKVSIERFNVEFVKLLQKSSKPSIGIEYMRDTGLLNLFIPELLEGLNVEQKLFHSHDVYHHSLATLDIADDSIKLAALFHDIGKPRCDTKDGHFYGHDKVGADITKEILARLRFPNEIIDEVCLLIANHMFYYPTNSIDDITWTDSAVRRFINRVGVDHIEKLFKLRIADATSNPKNMWDPKEIEILQDRISVILEADNALKISDLDIDGNDLLALGYSGKNIGNILTFLLEKVLDDPKLNNKSLLLSIIDINFPIR